MKERYDYGGVMAKKVKKQSKKIEMEIMIQIGKVVILNFILLFFLCL